MTLINIVLISVIILLIVFIILLLRMGQSNYNDQVDVYTTYKRKDNTLYFKTNVVREGKLVCIFKDYPCMKFSKIKMYNKRLFNKYRNNILGRNGILTNNTVYYAI